jgi:hypothetical protein
LEKSSNDELSIERTLQIDSCWAWQKRLRFVVENIMKSSAVITDACNSFFLIFITLKVSVRGSSIILREFPVASSNSWKIQFYLSKDEDKFRVSEVFRKNKKGVCYHPR